MAPSTDAWMPISLKSAYPKWPPTIPKWLPSQMTIEAARIMVPARFMNEEARSQTLFQILPGVGR